MSVGMLAGMTDEQFSQLVSEGIDALRGDVRARMQNVAIVIADRPTALQMQEHELGDHETLFGLYEGVPLTERGFDDVLLPDKITIFKEPILAAYSSPQEIAECVANTIWHEVAHHFGMGEERVAYEEEKRGKML